MSLAILDQSVAALKEALPSLSLGELEALREAEEAGKTRVSALAAIDEAIAAIEPQEAPEEPAESEDEPEAPEVPAEAPSGSEEVENIVKDSDITLHDGSHLLFGEKAVVPASLAAEMRERGQVR
jgi:hypothetical protein